MKQGGGMRVVICGPELKEEQKWQKK